MLIINQKKATALAANVRSAFASYDGAYAIALQLSVSLLDIQRGANLTARETQKALATAHQSAGNLLAGREDMVSLVTFLTMLQKKSTQAETDFGCAGDGPWTGAARQVNPLSAVA